MSCNNVIRETRKFLVVVVQKRQRNVQKSVMRAVLDAVAVVRFLMYLELRL